MWTVADTLEANFNARWDIAEVDGQFINVLNPEEALAAVRARLRLGVGFTFATLNVDHLVKRRADAAFREAYARATLVCADGAPIVALGRGQAPGLTRTTGADLMPPLCAMAARDGVSVAFFGSSDPVMARAVALLRRKYPDLRIAHVESPALGFDPFSDEAAAAGARIAASGAKLVFVCLGAPKQELFADRLARIYPDIGFIGVGAAVDFMGGAQRRAPRWMRRFGLEWVWRLASNPHRLAGRYARCALLLTRLVIEQRLFTAAAPRGAGAVPAE